MIPCKQTTYHRFFTGAPTASSTAFRLTPKPNATFVRSPLTGTGDAEGAGEATSLTILENPGRGAGELTIEFGGGDADADNEGPLGAAVNPVMSRTCGEAALSSFFFFPFFSPFEFLDKG